jgi:hypothetical protein
LRAEKTADEYELKAAVLVQFLNFVKWPGGASDTIGILGDDPFGDKLDKVRGRTKIKHGGSAEELKTCKIVFVSKSERGNVGAILASLADAHVLTVSDSDGFARQGGVIGLVMLGGGVRFEINESSEHRAGLTIGSKIKQYAIRIIK